MMGPSYQHQWSDSSVINLPIGKAVCVGRNFVDHAKELNNPLPEEPLLFMKPASCFTSFLEPIELSSKIGSVHYECEIVLLIKEVTQRCAPQDVERVIGGIGLGLDLTLREKQSELKSKGHPWERAKAFDKSCVLAPFIPYSKQIELANLSFTFAINHKQKQEGNSASMIFPIAHLISEISQIFSLYPGDVIMTGTPAGVGKLENGDELSLSLGDAYRYQSKVLFSD